VVEDVADLGPRVTTHVQALSHWLAESKASASLEWRSRAFEKATTVDTHAAAHLEAILREVEEDTRELVFTGRLVGGSLVRRTFELELEPPDSTVIGGRVAEESLEALEQFFGRQATAVLEVREARLPSGETKETHLLKQLMG